MAHASDGVLRRLEDEPFAIADVTFEHIKGCRRCTARRAQIVSDAGVAARWLSGPKLAPDVDAGWLTFQDRLRQGAATGQVVRVPRRQRRLVSIPVRSAVVAGVVVTAAVGSAAAATLTDVFAPTHVAPLSVGPNDVQAVAGFLSLADTSSPEGFPTSTGNGNLPFGSLSWSSDRSPQSVGSLAEAESLSGLQVAVPGHLPSGVGAPVAYVVQPKVSVTMTLNSVAGKLSGDSATLNIGPAVFVEYKTNQGVPTLGILTMARPTGTSKGATIDQIENYLLSRPGIPSNLATEIRLLGNVTSVLPVPTPAGMVSKSVNVGGSPGVLISVPSQVVSAVVWEDGSHIVHAVGGLLNQRGVLDVANQLG